MALSAYALIVLALGMLAALAGFLLAFCQLRVRALARRLARRDPPLPRRPRAGGQDPLHYAMIIAGVMLMAFGILIAAFTTAYELMTTAPR